MAKEVYKYKQVQLPEEAHQAINQAKSIAASQGHKVRMADLWIHAAEWVKSQVETNGYAGLITGKVSDEK